MGPLLVGKVALVTGGARGIGRACAEALAAAGAAVAIVDRLAGQVETARAEMEARGFKVVARSLDLTETARLRELLVSIEREMGSLDILINNAGVSPEAPTEEISPEQWDHVMDVNLKAAFFVTQAALPIFVNQGSGAIVNVSSVVARSGGVNSTVDYTASKAGVLGMTRALARQYGPKGVRVNAVTPGPIMTDMIRHWPRERLDGLIERIPLRRLGTREDVANSVLFLSSPLADYLTGVAIDVAGGLYMA